MSQEEIKDQNINKELNDTEAETGVTELPEKSEPIPEEKGPEKEEGFQARNFRALKDLKKKAERERDELLKRVQEQEEYIKKSQPKTLSPADDDLSIAPDDFVEGKHISRVSDKIKKLEENLVKQREETKLFSIEAQLKGKYPDFEQIVSKDNIDILKTLYPEIAQTIQNNQDVYSKAVSAYTLIKKFNIDNQDSFEKEKGVVLQNHSKPRPINSISKQDGSSPLHKANAFSDGLTEDLKKQLYKEMLEARKNY